LKTRIGLFLLLVLLSSAVFYGFIIATGHTGGGNGVYELGLMWSPALAAILTCKLTGLPLNTLGWKWGDGPWMWRAFLIPLLYTAVAYAAIWAVGFGGFPDAKFVTDTRTSLGWTNAPDALVMGGYFILIASAGMILSLAFALGEEIGWRGFLSPHLMQAFGFRAGAIVTGLIWAAWHLPLVLFADYNSTAPKWFAAICLIVLLVAMSVIMAWLRLRSGSLWTGALFHASHNQFIQLFFTPATHASSKFTPYVIDEFGAALPILVSIIALVIWIRLRSSGGTARIP
jgi:uncharacterized protein